MHRYIVTRLLLAVPTLAGAATLVFILMRLGLVAVIAMLYFAGLGDSYPITTDTSAWYSGIGFAALAAMAALALSGLVTALGLGAFSRGGRAATGS